MTFQWIRVTPTGNARLEGRAVLIGDRETALFNWALDRAGAGDQFLATDNQCPHKGGPLCDGIVTGASVVSARCMPGRSTSRQARSSAPRMERITVSPLTRRESRRGSC